MLIDFHTIGATIINWEAFGKPVLYCSDKAIFEEGKAIRGGCPICFPWFGPKEGFAQHGFARTMEWNLVENQLNDNYQKVVMELISDEATLAIWPFDFEASFTIEATDKMLTLTFDIYNSNDVPFEFGFALHTYFAVDSIHNTIVRGLNGLPYVSKAEGGIRKIETQGDIMITGETDRVYDINNAVINYSTSPVKIIDRSRSINIYHEGISDIVLWNPWKEKAAAMFDMDDDDYLKFVCVEGAISSKLVTLEPDSYHTVVQRVEVVKN
jgi:glucose-6-phosphate 1-epimerase